MAVYDPRGGGNVHIERVLTNISVAYQNESFISEVLAPQVKVSKQTDKYYEFGREAWQLEPGSTVRAPGTPAVEASGRTVSLNPYFCVEHALKQAIPDEEVQNADTPLSPRKDGTNDLTDKLMLERELAVKTIATTVGNYAAGHTTTLAGGTQWSNPASTPIINHRTARNQLHATIFKDATIEVMPYQVIAALENHAEFIERIKYSERGIISKEIMAALLGVSRVVVPGAGYNSATPGQSDAFGYIWGKDTILAHVPPKAAKNQLAYMYEFVWVFPGGQTRLVDSWRDDDRVSDMIRVRHRYDHRLIAVDDSGDSIAAYLYKDSVA